MPVTVPVYSYQSPGEQVGQLERRGQTRHHSVSIRTRSRQEETQSVQQFCDQTLISSDDDQRPAAQETKHGMLGEGVLSEEPEGSESSLPSPPRFRAAVAVDILGGRGRVRGAGEAGAVGRLVDAWQPERTAGRRPAVSFRHGNGRGQVDMKLRHWLGFLTDFRPLRRRLHCF